MARASGKAHIIVLDVGLATAMATGTDKQSFFQKSKACASLIIQRMIFSAPNDHVGVVLFGTDETDNQLNIELGGYEHITEAFDLKQANWATLRILLDQVTQTKVKTSWLEGLIVASNFLRSGAQGKKFTEYSIILISPLLERTDVREDQIESVLDVIGDINGALHLITNFVLHPAASIGSIFTTSGTFDEQASKTEVRSQNERLVKKLLKDTDGTLSNINWAERMLTFFDPKVVRPTPWNSILSIGTKVNVSISAYVMISEQKGLGSFKVDSADELSGTTSKVEMKTQYLLNDKPIEISMQDIIMGYMYGSTVVPYDNTIDIEYRSGESRLACLGFTASSNVLEEHLSSKGSYVVVAKKGCTASNHKLAALVKAMHELSVVMIATKVYRKDNKPRLNVLLPTYRHEIPCLVMMELIFKDELCCLKFPPLLKSKPVPTDEQYEAIDKLIDSMNLMDAIDDSNGESREAFALHNTYNPTLQHVYQAVAHRALHPKQPLPPVDTTLQELFEVPKKVATRSKPALDDVKRLFDLKEIKQNTRTEWLQRMAKIKLADDAASTVSTIDSGILMDDDDADRRMVVSVGSVTPAEDFALLLRRGEKFATVATQLQNILFELLFMSMRPPGDKVVLALMVYRSEAQTLGPYRYNEWVTEFKDMLLTRRKEEFWEQIIVGKRLGLIDSQESEMSTISLEQAENFYKTPTQNKTTVESSGGENIDLDSLFNELND
ncbi:X-ray repair cross-complementing protein 5-like [Anopheles marshallii]|uniref:X-ray repair cross-complementing protein 5-like n=1 Tax=Anopheles marshallii TaxID=1521116 RepID=UPI00237A42F8|nr:X-ray repair cross-complementing protein 5-like [Anopheles marshallii]